MKLNFHKYKVLFGSHSIIKIYFFVIFMLFLSFIEIISIGSAPILIGSFIDHNFFEKLPKFLTDIFEFFVFDYDWKFFSILIVIIFIIKNLVNLVYQFLFLNFLKKMHLELNLKLFNIYINQPLITTLGTNTGVLLRNLQNEIALCVEHLKTFINLLKDFLLLLFIFMSLLLISFKLTSIVLSIFILISVLFIKTIKKKIFFMGTQNQILRGEKLKQINEALGSIIDIKISNKLNFILKRFRDIANKSLNLEMILSILAFTPRIIFEILGIFLLIIILNFSLNYGLSKSETIAAITLTGVILIRMMPIFSNISSSSVRLKSIQPSLDLLNSEITNKAKFYERIDNKIDQISKNKDFDKSFEKLEIEKLKFKYKDNEKILLDIGNFEINRNDVIGIIGASGVGKSTLVNILTGLLDPTEGRILFNKKNIKENLNIWLNQISYVSQSSFILDDTIVSNIAFGEDKEKIKIEKIKHLIKFCGLQNLVDTLPEGIYSILGDEGGKLSSGQKQRISIARALYKKSSFLILDEATSNLDKKKEDEILDNLFNQKNEKLEKTVLIISHRESTLKYCNKIFNLSNGNLYKTD